MRKTTTDTDKASGLFKSWPSVILFYFIGLSIFFTVAFVIVALRISFKQEIKVPALVGKMYLDEHNWLQESGFQVKLEKVHSVNYPYGYVISQSLSPKQVVKYGQKLVLLVNQSKNIVKTPRIVGSLEALVPKVLSNVHSGKRRFKLNIGVITKVPSHRPKGEVLAQFPLPGTPVRPEYPVSFLVSLGDKDRKHAYLNTNDPFNLNRQEARNIEIVKSIAYHLKTPLDIEPVETQNIQEDGVVLESIFPKSWPKNWSHDKKKNDHSRENLVWKVKVGKYQDKGVQDQSNDENEFPFRFVWLTPDEIGVNEGFYTVSQINDLTKNNVKKDIEHSQFSYLKFKKDRSLPVFKRFREKFFFWENHYFFYHDLSASQFESSDTKDLESNINAVVEPAETYEAEDIEP